MKAYLRWYAYRLAWRLRFKRLAVWLLIDRSPLTATQIAYGQEVWARMQEE